MNLEFLNINLNYKIEFQEKSLSQYSKTKTSANKTKEHVKLSCFNDSFLASVKPYSWCPPYKMYNLKMLLG